MVECRYQPAFMSLLGWGGYYEEFLNQETVLEEVCWDVVCYLGQEVGGKSSFSDVRKYSFFVVFCFAHLHLTFHIILPETSTDTN